MHDDCSDGVKSGGSATGVPIMEDSILAPTLSQTIDLDGTKAARFQENRRAGLKLSRIVYGYYRKLEINLAAGRTESAIEGWVGE